MYQLAKSRKAFVALRLAAKPWPVAATTSGRQLASKGQYDDTLCLPKTEFPMRAKASEREPLIQKHCWDGYYHRQTSRSVPTTFILHDGPPFANGKLHMGHVLNKVLKDMISRYRMLRGDAVLFVPGWDCHGLPIEAKALASLKQSHTGVSATDVRKLAKSFALDAIQVQKQQFQRLGVIADWEHPYLTMDPSYEAAQLDLFYSLFAKGIIYRALKPVFWSPSSQTALAEAELEYKDHISKSIYLRFPLRQSTQLMELGVTEPVEAVIWTSTPWTIPANQSLAVHNDISYCIARPEKPGLPLLLVASKLRESLQNVLETQLNVVYEVKGNDLVGLVAHHPLDEQRDSPILHAPHVTEDAGTGVVHMAPAHGQEDFHCCRENGIDVKYHLVDERGRYRPEAGDDLVGKQVLGEGNALVLSKLQASGKLLHESNYSHRYPYDWRTHKPVLLRATPQWFADLTDIRHKAIAALDDVHVHPGHGRQRLSSMLSNRMEWCISRQRSWGVPIPVFYNKDTSEPLITEKSVKHVRDLVAKHGTDCWWTLPVEELLHADYHQDGCTYIKGEDTMDVWLDSGSSWKAVVKARHGESCIADMYLEGSDQHRGWFQSSLLTSAATTGHAPYKNLITHG